MVNTRHAGGRREVQRDIQNRGDTKKKKRKKNADKRGESEAAKMGAVERH